MTVNTVYAPISYPGAGTAAPLSVPWEFDAVTEVSIIEVDDATEAETAMSLGVHYTIVKNVGLPGGVVTPTAERLVGTTWVIRRVTPRLQPDSLRLGGNFSETTVEKMFDRGVRALQEYEAALGAGDEFLRADVGSEATGLGLDLDGTPAGAAINQTTTSQHFAQNGARIHRLNDRLLIGAATVNDGAFPNVSQDWQSQEWVAGGFSSGPMVSSILGIANNANPNNAIGVMSAVRTKDFTSAGTTAIPIFGCAWNDNPTLGSKVYGGYFEAHRTDDAGVDTYGVEIDTRTLKDSVVPNPFRIGDVIALQLASGAEWGAGGQFDASAAIQIAANPMQFKRGIVFGATAIDGTDGVTGTGEAMSLAKGHFFRWHAGVSTQTSYFMCTTSTTAAGVGLNMGDNQFQVLAAQTGGLQFAFVTSTSAVNYFAFYSAAAGSALRILAGGSDTNIDVSIEPKGSGHIRAPIANLRNFANDAAAAAGSPAVPIGGLYRNGSVVQVRVT